MGEIVERLMKKYWKNAKNTGKVYEKILEKCKNNWKSQGNSSVQKVGTMGFIVACTLLSMIARDISGCWDWEAKRESVGCEVSNILLCSSGSRNLYEGDDSETCSPA